MTLFERCDRVAIRFTQPLFMLTIRFNRTGRKNRPQFRVVVQEHTVAPGGRHVEILGSYDPYSKQSVLKRERIQYWIGHGAQLSDTVHNLLVRENVLTEAKRGVKMPKPVEKESTSVDASAAGAPVTAAMKAETPVKEEEKSTEK